MCKVRFRRGTGLGNRLFLWARCCVFEHQNTATMISPFWFRLCVGQLFRGGIEYRLYAKQILLFGQFKRRRNEVGQISGWFRQVAKLKIKESSLSERKSLSKIANQNSNVIVEFDRAEYTFDKLNGWNDFLYECFLDCVRDSTKSRILKTQRPAIGVNIRCGNDFKPYPGDGDYSRIGWLQKTPINWFIESIEVIREFIGYSAEVVIVSDGNKEALQEILKMQNVYLANPRSAAADLITLSRAKVLLASGSSTFSGWASFFGQMPTITAPGHPMVTQGIQCRNAQFNGEFVPTDPNLEFLNQVKEILT